MAVIRNAPSTPASWEFDAAEDSMLHWSDVQNSSGFTDARSQPLLGPLLAARRLLGFHRLSLVGARVADGGEYVGVGTVLLFGGGFGEAVMTTRLLLELTVDEPAAQ